MQINKNYFKIQSIFFYILYGRKKFNYRSQVLIRSDEYDTTWHFVFC